MRVIDRLRAKYPDVQWHYCMTKQHWEGSDGSVVARVSLTYDPDDENGVLWRYFKENKAPEYIGVEFIGKT